MNNKTANDIRTEIMSMDYNNPREVADALEHIADKLCEIEQLCQGEKYEQQGEGVSAAN